MKRLMFCIPLILLIVGCNNKSVSFSGESDNWEGEYSANISDNGTSEQGEYVFGYKNADSDNSFKTLEIIINDGETSRKEDNYKGSSIEISTGCSGCTITKESNPIEVTIKWDEEKDESFKLEPN